MDGIEPRDAQLGPDQCKFHDFELKLSLKTRFYKQIVETELMEEP